MHVHIPVEYEDARHHYYLQGKTYLSSTQIVEKFTNVFDAPVEAVKYAKKHGKTPQYWLDQWEEKNLKSLERGNYIHDANEMALHGRMIDHYKGKTIPVLGDYIRDETPWIERPDGVYLERKVWHHGYAIAGRVDKIILSTDPNTQTRYCDIQDYKTNAKLNKQSHQYHNGDYKRMKPPVAQLMDCNWVHYTLQLSFYQFMMEYQGFAPGDRSLIHYPHPVTDLLTGELIQPPKAVYPTDYLKAEVIKMLQYLRGG